MTVQARTAWTPGLARWSPGHDPDPPLQMEDELAWWQRYAALAYTPPAQITPAQITAAGKTAYYVSDGGSDAAAGTSPATAWQTIAKVNASTFNAGDGVFFNGNFGDAVLSPPSSGSSGSPVVFGSYGTARATLSLGVLVPLGRVYVTFDSLISKNVLGASTGTGKNMIVTQNSKLGGFGTEYGHECSNPLDSNWQFKHCEIFDTRDSGLINWGASLLVEGCSIHHTGTQFVAYAFGLHGIYSKSPGAIVRYCEIYDILDPDGQCVTTRFRNILIEGNYFHDAFEGVGYYEDDATAPGAGRTSTIRYNRMRNVQNGILIDPNGNTVAGMGENWLIYNNTITTRNMPGAGSSYVTPLRYYNNSVTGGAIKGTLLRVHNNIFQVGADAASFAIVDIETSPALATFSESNNVQRFATGATFFSQWNATGCNNLAAWVTASGQGSADVTTDPLLDGDAKTAWTSPTIDAGTSSISGVTFTPGNDGAPLHYAGTAPDIGASEHLTLRNAAFSSVGTGTSSFAATLVVIGSPGPYYGPQILNEGLYNNRIGLFGWKQANKERLEHGGSLLSISAYVVGTGSYGGGTGGSLRCRVETDNGSGRPSGTLVATGAEATLVLGRTTQVSTWTFTTPPTVTQGQLVHFVWENVDASPTVNYVSLDNIDVSGYEKLPQPTIPDSDRFVSLYDSGAWIDANDQYYPIFRTLYGDGYKGGQSHYECGTARYMGGTQKVRQKITPTANMSVRRVNVAVARYPLTTSDLTLTLRNLTAGGTVLDTRTVPVGAVHQAAHGSPDRLGYRHVGVSLSAPITLLAGTIYALELSSAETVDPYMTAPTRIGGVVSSFGELFDAADRVPDMLWEYTTDGSTWLTETGQSQAQLYFHLQVVVLAFTSSGTSTSTFAASRRRPLALTSAGTSTSTFAPVKVAPGGVVRNASFDERGASPVLDDFNHDAGVNLTSLPGWAASPLWSSEPTMLVNGVPDAAVVGAINSFRSNVWNTAVADGEAWAEAGSILGVNAGLDLAVRVTAFGAGASTYYAMETNLVSGDFNIWKYVAGVSGFLANNAVSVPHVAGDAWKIRVIGSTITAWRRSGGVWAQQALNTGASVSDGTITGAGRPGVEVSFASTAIKVNEFGGGAIVSSGGVGTSTFAPVKVTSGVKNATFTSAGTSTSVFAPTRRRGLALTSAGTSTSSFAPAAKRAAALTSAGTSTSVFARVARRALSFTSAGTSSSTFTRAAKRATTLTSAGTSTSTFAVVKAAGVKNTALTSAGTGTSSFAPGALRGAALTSAGASTSTFAVTRLGVLRNASLTSAGTSTSSFAPVAKRALALTSAGTSTSTFALGRRRPLALTSAGTSTSVFAPSARRAIAFTSAGTSTSTFARVGARPRAFTSAGTSTSVFAPSARRALAFTSAGTSSSVFARLVKRALALVSTGTSTSVFAVQKITPSPVKDFTLTSTGTSTSVFAPVRRRGATFTSTGTGTSTFAIARPRAATFASAGTSTSVFALRSKRALAFSSGGTGTSSFALRSKRALTFVSAGTGTSTFAPVHPRALAFASVGTSTSVFAVALRILEASGDISVTVNRSCFIDASVSGDVVLVIGISRTAKTPRSCDILSSVS